LNCWLPIQKGTDFLLNIKFVCKHGSNHKTNVCIRAGVVRRVYMCIYTHTCIRITSIYTYMKIHAVWHTYLA
jgi:hypothetical protein